MNGKMSLHDVIMRYIRHWESNDQWVMPDIVDSVDYMVSEAVEALQVRLRLLPNREGYVRNNPGERDDYDLAVECFDTVMMAVVTLELLGYHLEDVARHKLSKMNEERKVRRDGKGDAAGSPDRVG